MVYEFDVCIYKSGEYEPVGFFSPLKCVLPSLPFTDKAWIHIVMKPQMFLYGQTRVKLLYLGARLCSTPFRPAAKCVHVC